MMGVRLWGSYFFSKPNNSNEYYFKCLSYIAADL